MPVVISHATTLAPTGPRKSGFHRDVSERAVAVVLVQPVGRTVRVGPLGLEARSVHQKEVDLAGVIVIEEGHATAGGLEQVAVLRFGAENRLGA